MGKKLQERAMKAATRWFEMNGYTVCDQQENFVLAYDGDYHIVEVTVHKIGDVMSFVATDTDRAMMEFKLIQLFSSFMGDIEEGEILFDKMSFLTFKGEDKAALRVLHNCFE